MQQDIGKVNTNNINQQSRKKEIIYINNDYSNIIFQLEKYGCFLKEDDIKILKDCNINTKYKCTNKERSGGFTLIHKLVMLTRKYPKINDFLANYLKKKSCKYINKSNNCRKTPLHLAAINSKCESTEKTVQILVDAGANLDLKDNSGYTALHMATLNHSSTSSKQTIKILIDGGANVNIPDNAGWTPLHLAALYSRNSNGEEVVQMLIKAYGADINIQENKGWTALHLAARNSNVASSVKTVQMLVDAGCNIDIQENQGWTALHLAARNSNVESSVKTVQMLVDAGCNLNLVNNDNSTALHLVCQNINGDSNLDTYRVLVDAGINTNIKDNKDKLAIDYLYGVNKLILANNKKVGECIVCYEELECLVCSFNHCICIGCALKNNVKCCIYCMNMFV